MEIIPLKAVPNQKLMVTLGDQDCTIKIVQRGRRMYLTLYVDDEVMRQGAIMIPYVGLLGDATLFDGQLYIVDSMTEYNREQPPYYEELGTRYQLYYLDADEEEEVQAALLEAAENAEEE